MRIFKMHFFFKLYTYFSHKDWISCLSWKPCNLEFPCRQLISGSKDGMVNIWDVYIKKSRTINAHIKTINSVRWGGDRQLFSGSSDATIKVKYFNFMEI